MARTEPGRGVDAPDDGVTGVKSKGIPNVATSRLHRSIESIHSRIHTEQGLHAWEDTRRGLIDNGMKAKMIGHELTLRGERVGYDCKFCQGGSSS